MDYLETVRQENRAVLEKNSLHNLTQKYHEGWQKTSYAKEFERNLLGLIKDRGLDTSSYNIISIGLDPFGWKFRGESFVQLAEMLVIARPFRIGPFGDTQDSLGHAQDPLFEEEHKYVLEKHKITASSEHEEIEAHINASSILYMPGLPPWRVPFPEILKERPPLIVNYMGDNYVENDENLKNLPDVQANLKEFRQIYEKVDLVPSMADPDLEHSADYLKWRDGRERLFEDNPEYAAFHAAQYERYWVLHK